MRFPEFGDERYAIQKIKTGMQGWGWGGGVLAALGMPF